ncbi:DUF5658 family protein [Desulfotomaculum sp. 1211_IL3151]|uniref:DUF5658 family protein n=1 Tax=Desulfotomaculum sp. 1211_IL3151 TaxID=3084055 RepID=UPI003FA60A8C
MFICLLTLLDLLLTHYGISLGVIKEGNPLLSWLFSNEPVFTMVGAFCFVSSACLFLYRVYHRISWLPSALKLIMVTKLGVMILHCRWLLKVALF